MKSCHNLHGLGPEILTRGSKGMEKMTDKQSYTKKSWNQVGVCALMRGPCYSPQAGMSERLLCTAQGTGRLASVEGDCSLRL